MTAVTFAVAGVPVPQGSAKAIIHRSTGRAVLIPSRGDALADWRATVRHAALTVLAGNPAYALAGPVAVALTFSFARPKSHLRANGTLAPRAPAEHSQRPDIDKLVRAVFDALTGVAYLDDSQVAHLAAAKQWAQLGEAAGLVVTVEAITAADPPAVGALEAEAPLNASASSPDPAKATP